MKKLYLITLTFLSFSFTLCGSTIFPIAELEVSNPQWHIPPNGKPPKLLSYDIKFQKDPKHIFTATITPTIFGGTILSPDEFLQNGTELEIIQEGFILGNETFSFFLLRHPSFGVTFEAHGNAVASKAPSSEGAYPIKRVHYHGKYITFLLDKYLLFIPVESERFHGFYEGKSFYLRKMWVTPETELGQYCYKFLIEDAVTHQTSEATSRMMSERNTVTIQSMSPVNISRFGSLSWTQYKFNLEMTFSDSPYVYRSIEQYVRKGHPGENSERIIKEYSGDISKSFKIVEEIRDPKIPEYSTFTIESLDGSGRTYRLRGDARKSTY